MIISGLQPVTLSDFPEVPSCIIFTQGCNLKCPFCHNGDLIQITTAKDIKTHEDAVKDFLIKRSGKLNGVVFTGGEPLIHNDLHEWISFARELGYKVKLDTNGMLPNKLIELLAKVKVDYIAMDIKAPEYKYDILTGTSMNFEKIKESINVIISSGIDHQFRTTYVKDLLDDVDIDLIKEHLYASYIRLYTEPKDLVIQKFIAENALDTTLKQ